MDKEQLILRLNHLKEYLKILKLLQKFAPIAKFRDLIVHEYARIDTKKVYSYLIHDLNQFDVFARAVVQYVYKKF